MPNVQLGFRESLIKELALMRVEVETLRAALVEANIMQANDNRAAQAKTLEQAQKHFAERIPLLPEQSESGTGGR